MLGLQTLGTWTEWFCLSGDWMRPDRKKWHSASSFQAEQPQLALWLRNICVWSLFPLLYKVLRTPSSLHLRKSLGRTTSLLYAHQQSHAEDSASHVGNKQISSVPPSPALCCCWRNSSVLPSPALCLLHLVSKNKGSGHNHSALNFVGTSLILVALFFSFKKFLISNCHRDSNELNGKLPLQVFQMEGLKAFWGRIVNKTGFSCLSTETFFSKL